MQQGPAMAGHACPWKQQHPSRIYYALHGTPSDDLWIERELKVKGTDPHKASMKET